MNKLLLAALVSALALPAYGQAVAPPNSGAASNPPATSQPPASPNPNKPGMTRPDVSEPDMRNPGSSVTTGKPTVAPGASGQAPGRVFQDLDTDGNGSLSEREYGVIGGPSPSFSISDTDRDGRISRDEYAKWLKTQPDRTPANPPAPRSSSSMGSDGYNRP